MGVKDGHGFRNQGNQHIQDHHGQDQHGHGQHGDDLQQLIQSIKEQH